jgi:hypothetical protein
MQYWVDVERLKYFMDFRGMTIADVEAECHTRTRHELFMKLMTEGGPTREFFLLGDIARSIDIPLFEFVKFHEGEEGDDSNDVHVFEKQKTWPLDYDESHYIDQSMGVEKLKEYNLI